MSGFYSLTVSNIKKESSNSVSITFDVPLHLKSHFLFKAGQYITIKHFDEGKEIRRAYSICSSANSDLLTVGIKRVEGGVFSVFATTSLNIGDVLQVMPPMGRFLLETDPLNSKAYLAFAAGSGITPILSMIKTVLEDEPDSQFVLVYGNKTLSESMFYSELQQLLQKFPKQLFIEFLFSREQVKDSRFGRIDRSIVNYIIKQKFKSRKFDGVFLCGPKPMIDDVSIVLFDNGFQKEQVHFELFSIVEEQSENTVQEGYSQVTVVLDEEPNTIMMSKKKTVLEAVLEHNIDAPYSCQGGICSTCIARIVEGKASMDKNQVLTDSEIAEGFILTCQAHPITANLIIDYDDV